MEISSVLNTPLQTQDSLGPRGQNAVPESDQAPEMKDVDIGAAIQELTQVSMAFNRRLQFSLNEKLGEVVVKVIDKKTDKVIKEIPPKELQIVHERIREALGLLFDERI
jgi:flagellar protein FlaG